MAETIQKVEMKNYERIDSEKIFEETKAIFHDKALSFMRIFNSSLFLADNDFESANSLNDLSSLKITAAATTGPAKGPLPTSSTPATNFKSFLQQP